LITLRIGVLSRCFSLILLYGRQHERIGAGSA
jgi:hypothetical protein